MTARTQVSAGTDLGFCHWYHTNVASAASMVPKRKSDCKGRELPKCKKKYTTYGSTGNNKVRKRHLEWWVCWKSGVWEEWCVGS